MSVVNTVTFINCLKSKILSVSILIVVALSLRHLSLCCVVFKHCIQRKIYYMQSKNTLVVFLFMYFVLWLFRKIFFFGTFCCCEEPIRFDV